MITNNKREIVGPISNCGIRQPSPDTPDPPRRPTTAISLSNLVNSPGAAGSVDLIPSPQKALIIPIQNIDPRL
jgi:hypothetical protein